MNFKVTHNRVNTASRSRDVMGYFRVYQKDKSKRGKDEKTSVSQRTITVR